MKVDAKVLHFCEICKFHSRKMKKNLLFFRVRDWKEGAHGCARINASGSAEPMSGSNPDEMDGEGAAFAKRRQLPRRKSQMASRGMEERDRIKGFHYRQVLL